MKKSLFFLLLFYPCFLFAQNWMPVASGETYHYRLDDSVFITHTIRVDSVKKMGNDSVFYLNRVLRWHEFPDDPFFPTDTFLVAFRNQGQFMGKTMTKTPNGDLVFHTENFLFDTVFIVRPLANVGESWLAVPGENIMATVASVVHGEVLGEPDSLKTIQFGNGAEWVLSKNHGLVQCLDFYASGLPASLSGLEIKGLGDRLYRFEDFFDFKVGDVQEYGAYYSGLLGWTGRNIKQTILEKSTSPDGFQYLVRQITKATFGGLNSGTDYMEDTVSLQYSLVQYSKSIAHNKEVVSMQGMSQFQYSEFSYASIFEHGIRFGRKPSLFTYSPYCPVFKIPDDPNDPAFYIDDALTCSGFLDPKGYFEELAELGRVEFYASGVDNSYYETLKGMVSQGDTIWGNISPDWVFTAAKEVGEGENTFRYYPNPAQDFAFLECPKCADNPCSVQIFSLENKLFRTVEIAGQEEKLRIDLSGLPTGFYFATVRWKGGVGYGKLFKTN